MLSNFPVVHAPLEVHHRVKKLQGKKSKNKLQTETDESVLAGYLVFIRTVWFWPNNFNGFKDNLLNMKNVQSTQWSSMTQI